ncbi:MAG TPA: NAD(P)-dependent oxidoreductase [Stellaceae bacterium]|nr:NAD(P)-dependent oxidoreductase [Stellaceae bacterium]
MRTGFIGLGRMGRPMSQSLVDAGYQLTLCDARTETAAEAARAYGAAQAATPAEIARRCDVAVISVPGPEEVETILFGAEGLVDAAKPGFLVIDMTTNTVSTSRDFYARARAAHVDYLDAPVSRGNGTGKHTVMVGGDPAAFERARPLLEAIAATVCHIGPTGSGTATKLVNQAVYVAYMAAFAEGLAMAEAFGVPLEAALAALGRASAGDPLIMTKYGEIRGLVDKRFAVASALRYLDYADEAFGGLDTAKPVIDAAAVSLRAAVAKGLGGEDIIVGRHGYLARGKR